LNLDDLTNEIDEACAEILGEQIIYTPSNRRVMKFNADVEYDDGVLDLAGGNLIAQDIAVTIRKSVLPFKPSQNDRIAGLRRLPGKVFRPVNPTSDKSGTHWVVSLKEVK
jgi:hypothetical protein